MSDELSVTYPVKDLLERMDSKLDDVHKILAQHTTEIADLRREQERKKKARVEFREIMVAVCAVVAASGTAFGAVHIH